MTKEIKSVPLTSLKSLGGIAPIFDMPVHVDRVDGTKAEVIFKMKGMKRKEWAVIRDELLDSIRGEGEKATDVAEKFTYTKQIAEAPIFAAEAIMKAATGWSLEEDFTAEKLCEMEDEIPGALQSTLEAIDAALFQGRVGN